MGATRVLVIAGLVGSVVMSVVPGAAAQVDAPTLLFERSPGDECLSDLYLIRADRSGAQRLTHDSQYHRSNPFTASFNGRWSPDGSRIVFSREQAFGDCAHLDTRDDVFVMQADRSGVRRLTKSGDAGGASYSPDGTQLVFDQGGSVVVSGVDAKRRRVIARNAYGAAWSPDGSRLLYADDNAAWVVDLATGRRLHVAGGKGDYFETPGWSADGAKIIFPRARSGRKRYELWEMNWNGSGKTRLTSRSGTVSDDECPVESPDGTQIAFTRSSDRRSDLMLLDEHGVRTLVAGGGTGGGCPAWSRDGSVIAFGKSCGEWVRLSIIRPDGSGQRRLTTCHADTILEWRP
jgi:Tol biopolymer transport system component